MTKGFGRTRVMVALDREKKTIVIRHEKPMQSVGLDEEAAMQLIGMLAKHLSILKGVSVSIVIGEEGDQKTPSSIAAYLLTVRMGCDRAVYQEGEIVGYWQTTEWIEGLIERAEELKEGDRNG